MLLIWDDQASIDLESTWSYIAEDSVSAANKVFTQIKAGVNRLAHFPKLGRSGKIPGTREFVYSEILYVAIYALFEQDDRIVVLRIIHTSQLYPPETAE